MKEFLNENWFWLAVLAGCIIAIAGWLWWYGNYHIPRPGPMTRQQRQEFVNGTVYDPRERQRQYELDNRGLHGREQHR